MKRSKLTLQDAADLCRELSELSRVGLPWEAAIDADCHGVIRRVEASGSEREASFEQGSDLRRVGVDVDGLAGPLRGVLELAIESEQPAGFLEHVARVLERAADWQRAVKRAMVYPLVVAGVAYAVAMAALIWYVPLCESLWGSLLAEVRMWPTILWLAEHARIMAFGLPIVALCLALLWIVSRRNRHGVDTLPTGLRYGYGTSLFLNILTCLTRNRVSLDRSLPLAAHVCGDKKLIDDANELSHFICAEGHIPETYQPRRAPRRLAWLLSFATSPQQLYELLQSLAHEYTDRADTRFIVWSQWAPVATLVVIGGSLSAVAVWLVVYPYAVALLRSLG